MSENKTGKYFKYAIGEIVLVVIGILIALQINTWNTNKNNSIKEQLYLKSFHEDIQVNLNQLDRVIRKSSKTISAADSILRFKENELSIKGLELIEGLIMGTANYTIFLSQEGTINDIFGSGDLALITNDSIRRSMVNWSAELKYLKEYETLGKNNQLEYIDFLSKNTKLYKLSLQKKFADEKTITKLLNDDSFLNLVSGQKRMARVLNGLYLAQKEKITNLATLVNQETN